MISYVPRDNPFKRVLLALNWTIQAINIRAYRTVE